MRVETGSVVEMKELMLASSLDTGDSTACKSCCDSAGKLPVQGGMKGAHLGDCFSFDGRTKAAHCILDFRKLWHCLGNEPRETTCATRMML